MLRDDDIDAVVRGLIQRVQPAGRRIVVVVPDGTRTAPVAAMAARIDAAIAAAGGAAELTWMVALGTHQPMSPSALSAHFGPVSGVLRNHEWWDPDQLVSVGVIPAVDVASLTEGRLNDPIDVRINRAVASADAVIICGPVFPHEVVGFSGGNKYFFPGVAGEEIIDATHWLGALITSSRLIGTLGPNPVRNLIDRAASLIPTERWCLALVVPPHDSAGPVGSAGSAGFVGSAGSAGSVGSVGPAGSAGLVACEAGRPEEAWAAAAAVSSEVHIRRLPAPVHTVLSVMPHRYADLWTAAKGMYKVEPVVADGGQVIIYAPHVTQVSVTHGEELAKVGYHVKDYFVGQWDQFRGFPGSVLAHSTHVTGLGTWSPADGERRRITVTLATGISEETCSALSLGYLDPASVDVAAWTAKAETDPGILVVPDAGEQLYRLADA